MNIPDLVIREIRARPVVAPLPRPIRTASGDVLDASLLLIDILTDLGVTGRAYAFAYTPLTLRSLAQFVRDIAPELIGKPVSPRERWTFLLRCCSVARYGRCRPMTASACSIAKPTCPGWKRPLRAASRRSRLSLAQETLKATWLSSLTCGGRSAP